MAEYRERKLVLLVQAALAESWVRLPLVISVNVCQQYPVLTDKQISIEKSLAADTTRSVEDICKTLKILPATYYRYIYTEKK